MKERYEAIVIGSGFGGGISACRLSKRWPKQVMVLERGKRYPMGAFPRTPHDTARNFWHRPLEGRNRPEPVASGEEQHGLFDVRNFKHMDVVLGAGLGGGPWSTPTCSLSRRTTSSTTGGGGPGTCRRARSRVCFADSGPPLAIE